MSQDLNLGLPYHHSQLFVRGDLSGHAEEHGGRVSDGASAQSYIPTVGDARKCVCVHMYVCMSVYMSKGMCLYIHVCVHVFMHVCLHAVFASVYRYMTVCPHVCMFVCV